MHNLINNLYNITNYFNTRTQYKGHGYYYIYEDDKIEISYDTYVPNYSVYVKFDKDKKLVLSRSRDYNQEYHPGAWEKYVIDILGPKATQARINYELKQKEKKEKEKQEKFGPINDSAIFG